MAGSDRRRPRWRPFGVLGLGLLVLGCAPPPFARGPATVAVSLRAQVARPLLAVAHRWVAADVKLYRVALQVHDGSAFVPTGLAQDLAPTATADFGNLAAGKRYRAAVEAWGNVGGTAAAAALNTATPCFVEFDFTTTAVDMGAARTGTATVTLDAAPFEGTATITVTGLPAATASEVVELWTQGGGAALATQTFGYAGTTATFGKLAAGPTYFAKVVAKNAAGGVLATGQSATWRFDPAGQDVAQEVSKTLDLAL